MEELKEIMKLRGFTYKALADKLGITPPSVDDRIHKGNIRSDKLIEMLEAMDCELVIRSKLSDKSEWVLK